MKETKRPCFAITMGDPAGIGPEIALRALTSSSLPQETDVFVIGDKNVMEYAMRYVSAMLDLHEMNSPNDFLPGSINILDMQKITMQDFIMGKPQAQCGAASYAYINKAIDLAMKGSIAGIVTNPISKEALHLAGINYPGHTEILAEKTGTKDFSMLFAVENVYVSHVTAHVSVRKAIDLVSRDNVLMSIQILNGTLHSLGITTPRIGVGGLNPHAGEAGLFGDEEIRHIIPAIADARSEGINATGPFPPDTVFMRAFKGEFDGVVSMLHDHGFGALKARNFSQGVNITVGLPIIRTSVGHGTAFDIAGKGIASEESLLAAIRAALLLWKHKQQ